MFLISNRHCRSLSFFFIYVDFHRRHLCDYYHVRNKLCHEYVNVLVYDWLTTLEIFSYVGLLTTVYIQNLTNISGRLLYGTESCKHSCVADTSLLCCSVICGRCLFV